MGLANVAGARPVSFGRTRPQRNGTRSRRAAPRSSRFSRTMRRNACKIKHNPGCMQAETSREAICVLFVTIDEANAETFARGACQRRLVACANMLPGARSIYWWDGALCDEREVLLWMEAPAQGVQERIEALAALHPYDTPKIIALPPSAVHEPYRVWCLNQTLPNPEEEAL